ncbi:MAG: MMPL family transporter [Solirubrobacterales bacterium]
MYKKRKTILDASVDAATRNPRRVIAVWAIAIAFFGITGLWAKQVLKAEDLVIGGTPSAKAVEQERKSFGESSPLVILLEGPPKQLDRYGPKVVNSLTAIDGVNVSDPWSTGAPDFLREQPSRALLLVLVDQGLFETGKDVLPKIDAQLESTLPSTIEARVAGEARFSTELVNLVFSGALRAELIALPFLLLILLFIFRAPIAAALPLVQGVAVIALTTGFVTLLGRIFPVNVLAQASGSIIGLALGVDYSLLLLARFRDELRAGKTVDEAVAASMATAGRTVTFAGAILALAGLLVIAVTVGWASMATGSIGVIAAAVFSVLAAFTLLPACLATLGENVNRWPIGEIRSHSGLAPAVNRLIRRPAIASIATLIPLLLLCGAAFSLQTGGPDPKVFGEDNDMRIDIEAVASTYGGGVMAPYQVLIESASGPITSPKDIRALEDFQQQLAGDPEVKYVLGPGISRVRKVSESAEKGTSDAADSSYGLAAASTAASKVRRGIGEGSTGAERLAAANDAALAGARQLQAGFAAAASGASSLDQGLSQSATGSKKLDAALAKLSRGARQLRSATSEGRSRARSILSGSEFLQKELAQANGTLAAAGQPSNQAMSSLSTAKNSLDSLPPAIQSEPAIQSALSAIAAAQNGVSASSANSTGAVLSKYRSIAVALDSGVQQARTASSDLARLSSAVGQLDGGLREVARQTGGLSSGLSQLASGSAQLRQGLGPLQSGASSLSSGLDALGSGSSSLKDGLAAGAQGSRKLERGIGRLEGAVNEATGGADGSELDLKEVGKSAYLTMALLSAAPPEEKRNLQFVLNEERGGGASRIYLFTTSYPTAKSIGPFADRLAASTTALSKKLDAEVSVGGQGQTFHDYDVFTKSRIWPLIAALALMSFLFLLVIFRSVLLAAKAVVLNLITVGAAMGVVRLVFGGVDPVFGGPGWMEATSFFVVFSTTFALSMDYEIFMINRMRESYVQTGSNDAAISEGIAKTASVVSGSAAVMIVLFTAMAFASELVSNAQMGLGLAVAILIDATIVRLILLPASMRLFGDANWWLPEWLDRRMPNVAIH